MSASGTSGTGPRDEALLTSTSSPPSAPSTCIAIGWISSLRDTSPTMPLVPGTFAGDAFHALAVARDEGDERSAATQLADERQAEARRSPGDRDP